MVFSCFPICMSALITQLVSLKNFGNNIVTQTLWTARCFHPNDTQIEATQVSLGFVCEKHPATTQYHRVLRKKEPLNEKTLLSVYCQTLVRSGWSNAHVPLIGIITNVCHGRAFLRDAASSPYVTKLDRGYIGCAARQGKDLITHQM